MQKLKDWLAPLVYLGSNWISLVGIVLVTTGGLLWVILLPTMLKAGGPDPYLGILEFMVLPAVFFAGLALIPLGIWWARRKNQGKLPEVFPPVDLANLRFRKLLVFFGVTTVLNLVIGSQLIYRAVHYMESVSFCGQTCHVVMKPEFTAYQNSPHARVDCVNCHIGPGANWFVKSKISGSWQVISVTFNLYPRPIETPIKDLRPARETCEICHWPQKYGGDRVRVLDKFADDEASTQTKTVLLMHIGGGNGYQGIHGAHMGPGVVMRYAPKDGKRMEIPWVEYSKNGEKVVYKAEGYQGDGPGNLEVRTMDCIDCHNRPSHTFELPARALDRALASGEVDRSLPFAKKTAIEVMQAQYSTTEESEREIPARFASFYQKNHPEVYAAKKAQIEKSAKAVLAAYSKNVFPEMNVKWGVYPNHLGHEDFPGCFRCHDGRAGSKEGRELTQDCDTCHKTLAMEEPAPKVLQDLGLAATSGTN
jgi:hypothetical protein